MSSLHRCSFLALSCVCLLAPVLLTACPEKTDTAPKACCDQPEIPAGVTPFKVVADDVTGPSDGQRVSMAVVLSAAPEREAMYPVLHTLYRWMLSRGPFEPIELEAAVYADEAGRTARKPVATIARRRGAIGPTCENEVPWTFVQSVERAFAASLGRLPEEDPLDTCHMGDPKKVDRVDATFAHQPKLEVDEAGQAATVTYPYLAEGKDEYKPDLGLNSALAYWIEFTTSMFKRAPALQTFTFRGLHDDKPVVDITVSRKDFDNKLSNLQEEIAAHAALTFQKLGMNATNEKAAFKEQESFKTKTYREALAMLPKGQVQIAKSLK